MAGDRHESEGTERRRVGTGLSENEERLQAIVSQAAVGIAQISLDGEWLRGNKRFCEMLGYSEAELHRKTLHDLTHPDDWDLVVAGRRQLLTGEISSHTIQKRYIRKDGTVFWGRLHRSLARDRNNRPRCIIAVVEDINEKIQVERALQDSEQRLMMAQKAAHLALWDRDLSTNVITISGEYSRVYGLAADRRALTYEEWLTLVHPEDRERVQEHGRDTITRTNIWDEEFRVVWPDGSVHWLLGKGTVFRDDSGQPVRIAGVNLDITGRKRAEEALRESEARLRLAQQVASIGTFDWNIQTGINAWTQELEAMYGLRPGDFPGRQSDWENLIHPDDRAGAFKRVKQSFESRTPAEGEWRVIWPDGSVHWLAGRWQVFGDAAGTPLRMTGVNIDVTDRKYMEEALRHSEERFRLAVQATNDAIWDIDLVSGTVHWNETYAALYGRPPETSNSWQWWIDRIHPEDRERTSGGLRSAINGGESTWTSEYRFQRVDGAWAYIYDRAYIARDASGNAWRVIGAMQDLTERRRAEEALRESDLQYKEIFDNISVCMFVIDVTREGRFKFAGFNRAEEEAIGFSNAEVSGRFVEDVFGEELANKLTADYRRCLEAGRAIHYDSELNLPRGRRYFHSNLIPLRNDAGVISRIIGACIDTTDLRRTQEEALAKQNLEGLGVLAGGIAHDFNNVLGGILAQAELVEPDLPVGSAPIQEIQRIKAAALRGSEIVRELMIYAGQDQTHLVEPVDLSRLVGEILELLKVSISKQAVLRTDLSDDLPPVLGNSPQIRQVVMNLIINASEAIGDKKGVIALTTTLVSGAKDLAPNSAAELPLGDYVRLEVSDTGGGITEEAKEKIFDPFFSTKFAGRGMGLAVVQRVVRDHGGVITIVSAPGQGATFQVLFPCRSKEAPEIHSVITSAGLEQSNARTGTILVVEDEEILRLAVSKLLRKIGFSVMAASDGSAAIDLVRTHKDEIDVILLDLTLPGLSSREVFEEALRVQPNLTVVLTSAYSKEAVDASFPGLRITHFIRKPFQLGELGGVLRDALSAKVSASHSLKKPPQGS
jgi:PAS domain S-box-containing protein